MVVDRRRWGLALFTGLGLALIFVLTSCTADQWQAFSDGVTQAVTLEPDKPIEIPQPTPEKPAEASWWMYALGSLLAGGIGIKSPGIIAVTKKTIKKIF